MASLSFSYFLSFSFFFFFSFSSCMISDSSDVILLLERIKPSLQGSSENLLLSSWNFSIPLCLWRGLKWGFSNGSVLLCSQESDAAKNLTLSQDPNLQLLSLELPASGISGTIPKEIAELTSLQSLHLGVNSLTGSVPFELGNSPWLSVVDLRGNALDGSLPPSIWNLCDRISSLLLHGNRLSGFLPEPALPNTNCSDLQVLDLGSNRFEGGFPRFLTGFRGLKELDLGSNLFAGRVPEEISALNLERLNLSYNNFSGVLPEFDSKIGAESFRGNNPGLCGAPLKQCRGSSGLDPGVIAGIVIGLMAGIVVLASLLIGSVQGKRWRSWRNRGRRVDEAGEMDDEENCGGGGGGEGKLILFQGGEDLTPDDVLNATGQVMEKMSYGAVYKAKLVDGGTIALRLLREGSCRDLLSCLPVVRQLGRLRHENIVPLRAFYQGNRGEKLLIYDYIPSKTLHDLLHETSAGPLLNWARRHKIALGIAQGLAYLHTGHETPITHGNVQSKNILIDEFYVARLTECGVDKLLVPAVADELVAAAKSGGYKAPELNKMKKSNSRTDVYAFGILLLEILLRKKPSKDVTSREFVDLPSIVKMAVLEETTMDMFDVDVLKGIRSPMEDGLVQALKLAMGCCAPVASVRPDMDEVVKQLEENRPRNRSALYSPTDTESEIGTPY